MQHFSRERHSNCTHRVTRANKVVQVVNLRIHYVRKMKELTDKLEESRSESAKLKSVAENAANTRKPSANRPVRVHGPLHFLAENAQFCPVAFSVIFSITVWHTARAAVAPHLKRSVKGFLVSAIFRNPTSAP